MKVGIIGLGNMGFRMAESLIKASYTVLARDIGEKAEERARELGVKVVKSPKEVAGFAQIILLSLPMPSEVKEVVLGEDGILANPRKDCVVVDLSTVDPFSTQQNAQRAKKNGVGYIDAPVLGRPQKCGNWTLPVGGDRGDSEKRILQA